MNRKIIFGALIFITAAGFAFGCGIQQSGGRAKHQVIEIPGGTVSPALGIGFDVTYDPSLDNVIPGYKLMTVAFTNNSMDIMQLNSTADSWYVEDRKNRKIKAVINLRNSNPDVWSTLPKKLKILIEYPLYVTVGTTQTIDLLFPENVDLEAYRAIIFRAAGTKNDYRILPREE